MERRNNFIRWPTAPHILQLSDSEREELRKTNHLVYHIDTILLQPTDFYYAYKNSKVLLYHQTCRLGSITWDTPRLLNQVAEEIKRVTGLTIVVNKQNRKIIKDYLQQETSRWSLLEQAYQRWKMADQVIGWDIEEPMPGPNEEGHLPQVEPVHHEAAENWAQPDRGWTPIVTELTQWAVLWETPFPAEQKEKIFEQLQKQAKERHQLELDKIRLAYELTQANETIGEREKTITDKNRMITEKNRALARLRNENTELEMKTRILQGQIEKLKEELISVRFANETLTLAQAFASRDEPVSTKGNKWDKKGKRKADSDELLSWRKRPDSAGPLSSNK